MAKIETPQSLKEAGFLDLFFKISREHGINPRKAYLRLRREIPGIVTKANSGRFDDLVEKVRKSAESVQCLKVDHSDKGKKVYLQNPGTLYYRLTGEESPKDISCRSLNFAVAFYFPFSGHGYQEEWAEVFRDTGIDFLRDDSKEKVHVIPVIRVNSDHKSMDGGDRLLSAIFGEDYQQKASLEHGLKHNIDTYFLDYTGYLGEFSATLHQPSSNPIELDMAYNDDLMCLRKGIDRAKKYASDIRDICSGDGEMARMARDSIKKCEQRHKQAGTFKARILKTTREILNMDVSPRVLSFIVSSFAEPSKLYRGLIAIRDGLYFKAPGK